MRTSEISQAVAVAGAGNMGAGIAVVAARGGLETLLYDVDASRLDRAIADARAFVQRSVKLGKLTSEAAEQTLNRLRVTADIEQLGGADLVIEAVFEDFAVKAGLLAQLHRVVPAHAVLASNTSTLSITKLAAASGRPSQFVGLHFCLPAQVMKLVEVTPGRLTSGSTVAAADLFCERTGQIAIHTQDTPGFILNYFAIPLNNDAIRLVEQGVATPEAVDTAVRKGMGYPMGPLQLVDMVGLDTQERLCDAFYKATRDPRHACPGLVRQMVAAGQLGKRVGRGFYDYASTATFGA